MAEFGMDEGIILIVPGYTEQEIMEMEGYSDDDTSTSSDTNSSETTYLEKTQDGTTPATTTTETTSTTNDNSTSTIPKKEIKAPPAMYFKCKTVEFTPHIKDYEEFSSAEGLILIEKACDRFAEVQLEVLVHQKISTLSGKLEIDGQQSDINIYVEDFTQNQYEGGFEVWEPPKELKDGFIELRRSFFSGLSGRPLTVISPLTQNIACGYMTECDYTIGEGEVESTWNITIREVNNAGF